MTAETLLTDEDREALGIREADCGCCSIVDNVGLRETIARHRAEAWDEGWCDGSDDTKRRRTMAETTRNPYRETTP